MDEAVAREERFAEEVRFHAKDGHPYRLRLEVEPLRDRDGQLLGFLSLQTDIAERDERKAELRNLRTAVEQRVNAQDFDRILCLEAGMHAYLCKPIRVEQLAAAIAQA